MRPNDGPAVLGDRIREVYSDFFTTSHEPFKESDEEITRLFNIHSGGSEGTLKYQAQTFKALCEFATFDGANPNPNDPSAVNPSAQQVAPQSQPSSIPAVHIDLHIHLPENKSTRDYQAIIEDIARYIYRHQDLGDE